MVLLQNPENSEFLLEVFLLPSFLVPVSVCGPDFSEMNKDADLIFIAM